jgi:GTP-binding protein HflX
MRTARDRSGIPKVAIVGYTNAGKSTLLNALTDAGVLCQDRLFATLDPTTRRLTLPNGEEVLLTDTVGFIRKLPHHLVHAFRSTLDEVTYADILMVVSDALDPEAEEHIAVTEELLKELKASDKPVLYVYNKCDLLPDFPEKGIQSSNNKIYISAEKSYGLDLLLNALLAILGQGKRRVELKFSYTEQAKISTLHSDGTVERIEYREDGIYVEAILDEKGRGKYAAYLIS